MWTVNWVPHAENRLASLGYYAPDRKVITEAANGVDELLANNPTHVGVPFGQRRMLFQPPLAVTYAVDVNQKTVEVLEVERISQ
jgi:hypothetical protein